ncbi:MAG: hypothetical protein H6603_07110 [Flavobacteriales bacterium]|nr:hypothetical protein [Flavobacteriales bacterium]MCB9191845.1 hypothetical protein [Flavobacteriales bacterium]MCB9204734.1 hypothetical protein [Flavobacteriales bacterium]
MKKLSKEEAASIATKPPGRSSVVRSYLLGMEVGDIILLEKKDWKQRKRKPSTYCRELERKSGRQWKCETALDGSGWVIERVK